MKLISPSKKFVGRRVTCEACDAIFDIEEGDKPRTTRYQQDGQFLIHCKECESNIYLFDPDHKKESKAEPEPAEPPAESTWATTNKFCQALKAAAMVAAGLLFYVIVMAAIIYGLSVLGYMAYTHFPWKRSAATPAEIADARRSLRSLVDNKAIEWGARGDVFDSIHFSTNATNVKVMAAVTMKSPSNTNGAWSVTLDETNYLTGEEMAALKRMLRRDPETGILETAIRFHEKGVVLWLPRSTPKTPPAISIEPNGPTNLFKPWTSGTPHLTNTTLTNLYSTNRINGWPEPWRDMQLNGVTADLKTTNQITR